MTDPKANEPVSTDQNPAHPENQSAMQDEAIVQRLADNPEDPDAQLDAGLDHSMDASDPVATVQPGDTGEPLPSSGYDEAHEEKLRSK
jgi:hypothetical protein